MLSKKCLWLLMLLSVSFFACMLNLSRSAFVFHFSIDQFLLASRDIVMVEISIAQMLHVQQIFKLNFLYVVITLCTLLNLVCETKIFSITFQPFYWMPIKRDKLLEILIVKKQQKYGTLNETKSHQFIFNLVWEAIVDKENFSQWFCWAFMFHI